MFGLPIIEFVLITIMAAAASVALGGGIYLFVTRERKERRVKRERLDAYWTEIIATGKKADRKYRRANGRFRHT